MSQSVLYAPASCSLMELTCDDPPESPTTWCKPSRELLTAWLLFLLDCEATYGYELHRQLEAHGVTIEIGAMYRALRRLEADGCAGSSWAKSVTGPRRRLYQLTPKGRGELEALVQAIAATRDVHAAFLHAHSGEPG